MWDVLNYEARVTAMICANQSVMRNADDSVMTCHRPP